LEQKKADFVHVEQNLRSQANINHLKRLKKHGKDLDFEVKCVKVNIKNMFVIDLWKITDMKEEH